MNDSSSQTTERRAPIDVMDEALRQHLSSMEATSAAVACYHALRRAGWLQDEPMDDGNWMDDDPGTCAKCGTPFELVRPGKSQPTCDCYGTATEGWQE